MTGSTQTDDQGTSRHNDDGSNSGDDSTTWHDVALAIAAELMGKIRRDIYERLGYSTSAVGGKAVACYAALADKQHRVSLETSSSLRSSSVGPVTGDLIDVLHSSPRRTGNLMTKYARFILYCGTRLRRLVSEHTAQCSYTELLATHAIPEGTDGVSGRTLELSLCSSDSFPRRQARQSHR